MKLEKLLFIAIICLKGEQGKDWEYLERLWVKDEVWLTLWTNLMVIRMNSHRLERDRELMATSEREYGEEL